MSIFTGVFWKDTTERTVSSFAQGVVIGLGAAQFTDIGHVVTVSEAAAVGGLGLGILTFFKCIAASYVGNPSSASLVNLTPPAKP